MNKHKRNVASAGLRNLAHGVHQLMWRVSHRSCAGGQEARRRGGEPRAGRVPRAAALVGAGRRPRAAPPRPHAERDRTTLSPSDVATPATLQMRGKSSPV